MTDKEKPVGWRTEPPFLKCPTCGMEFTPDVAAHYTSDCVKVLKAQVATLCKEVERLKGELQNAKMSSHIKKVLGE